jgi:hypothetical protein
MNMIRSQTHHRSLLLLFHFISIYRHLHLLGGTRRRVRQAALSQTFSGSLRRGGDASAAAAAAAAAATAAAAAPAEAGVQWQEIRDLGEILGLKVDGHHPPK